MFQRGWSQAGLAARLRILGGRYAHIVFFRLIERKYLKGKSVPATKRFSALGLKIRKEVGRGAHLSPRYNIQNLRQVFLLSYLSICTMYNTSPKIQPCCSSTAGPIFFFTEWSTQISCHELIRLIKMCHQTDASFSLSITS